MKGLGMYVSSSVLCSKKQGVTGRYKSFVIVIKVNNRKEAGK